MSNHYVIEDGIPIPTAPARKGHNIELLSQMRKGQSVFFDAPIKKRATRFYRVAKHIGAKVIIRKEGEGMRMWLVEPPTKLHSTNVPSTPKVAKVAKPAAKPVKVAKKIAPKKAAKTVKAKRDPNAPTRDQMRAAARAAKARPAEATA